MRCEPPTKRESCAPPAVVVSRASEPGFAALPAWATYQSRKRWETSAGSAAHTPSTARSKTLRVSASGMFCSFQVSLVMASHSRARGAVQGRSSGRVAASASMRPMSAATSPMLGNGASGELAGNGVRCPSQLRMV